MSAPALVSSLSELADRYDAVICDVWGVVHNGVSSFPAAAEALAAFQRERGPVVLVSNAPRPSQAVVAQLRHLGVPQGAWASVVTSGDVTRDELKARAPGPAWAIGPARDAPLYDGTGVEFVETPEQAAFVACTGLFDDELESPEDYRGRLLTCARRDLVMICANPDRVVQRGTRMIYCGGALADLYEDLGGKAVMAGKPYPPIYQRSYSEIDRVAGRPVDRSRILAIGDGLPTDVEGANAQGLDLLFIASGIHAGEALGPDGALEPARLDALLHGHGASARYAMPALAW